MNLSGADGALAWVNAAGGLAGFLALVLATWGTRRRKRVPDPMVRGLLEALIEDFNSIVAAGGQPVPWFVEDERRRRELALATLNGTIVDDALHTRVAAARNEYQTCFACSSFSRPSNQVSRQIEAASAGRRAATDAVDRLNTLVRKFGHL